MEEAPPSGGMFDAISSKTQFILDKMSPHYGIRWIIFSAVFFFYVLRVYLVNGWYIVSYGLGIYLLNQLIGFISPQFDPDEGSDGGDMGLPTANAEEFRPFARRLPEFKFWLSCTRGTVTAFFMTFFSTFDIPVFWPILVLYFFVLFAITMKRQIKHMIKHRYVPWSTGKAKYKAGKAAPGKGNK